MSATAPKRPRERAGAGLVEDRPVLRRLAARAGRHWRWGRADGFGRLVEEDRLDPRVRFAQARARRRWRREHPLPPGSAQAVHIVGVQRSGTNMVLRGIEALPEAEVFNENERRVFRRYQLRSDEAVRAAVAASRHRYVLLKPLCDSHRVDELLDVVTPGARALWVFRSVDGRVRSSVAKFGDANRTVLSEIAAGRGAGRWQAQRLSADTLAKIGSLDWENVSPTTASALFWYARNALFFELGLHERPDVMPVSYEGLVSRPEAVMRAVCGFLGMDYDPRLIAHIAGGRGTAGRVAIDPRVRGWCDELEARLVAASWEAVPA